MDTAVSPGSAKEALRMLRSAMGYLAAADAAAIATETQAQCLLALEQLDAIETAARASILTAFAADQGYSADADYSPRAWLIHKTRITKGAAMAHTAWVVARRPIPGSRRRWPRETSSPNPWPGRSASGPTGFAPNWPGSTTPRPPARQAPRTIPRPSLSRRSSVSARRSSSRSSAKTINFLLRSECFS